ncbi:MAG: potassium-transporting ATPase subunit KdpC [Methylococcales bacterium]
MWSQIRPAISMLVIWTVITGIAYPALVTAIAQGLFSDQANGSLIFKGEKALGSALIGQSFNDPKYFWGRPSATTPVAYNGAASQGSNLGPSNPALMQAVAARVENLRQADPDNRLPVPVDLVTSSASGLDPHISPAAAEYQVNRVAKIRNVAVEKVRELVSRHTEARQFGILGEARVQVLQLNLALDELGACPRIAIVPRARLIETDFSIAFAANSCSI